MYPTAVSQVFEAVIKLISGIGFAGYGNTRGVNGYTQNGYIFGV